MMKVLKAGEVLVTSDGVFRYNSVSKCMEKVVFCDDGQVVTPKLGTGDDPK